MNIRRYHHGDVPSAVRRAALERLEAEGSASITMRALASDIGVDHRALYRHFADRDAVLADLAAEGFRALLEALKARSETATVQTPLHADFAVYLRFALEQPGLHGLMLTRARTVIDTAPSLNAALNDVLAHLMRSARAALGEGATADQAKDTAFAALSCAFGLVSLAASQTLQPRSPEALEAFLIQQVNNVIDGQLLRARG